MHVHHPKQMLKNSPKILGSNIVMHQFFDQIFEELTHHQLSYFISLVNNSLKQAVIIHQHFHLLSCNSPDNFQEKMSELMEGYEVDLYDS
jgi:hypothetical protein